ncbi:hypothetical protein [Polaromonas sp. YR568]|uniref:hypothetical protein n=1 Tax=Polaromonas sp. YR568 TaxID=1855301 RepID=UPI00398BDF9F
MKSHDETSGSLRARASKFVSCLIATCGALIGVGLLWMAAEGIAAQGMFVTCRKVLRCWVSASETPGSFWLTAAMLSLVGLCFSAYSVLFVYTYLKMRRSEPRRI